MPWWWCVGASGQLQTAPQATGNSTHQKNSLGTERAERNSLGLVTRHVFRQQPWLTGRYVITNFELSYLSQFLILIEVFGQHESSGMKFVWIWHALCSDGICRIHMVFIKVCALLPVWPSDALCEELYYSIDFRPGVWAPWVFVSR